MTAHVGNGDQTAAYGAEVDPDDPWVAARKELYPAPSLTRIGTNARWAVANVTVVGTLLTLFGLIAVPTHTTADWILVLAYLSAGVALIAMILSWIYLIVRVERFNVQNLDRVRDWYARQFARANLVVAGSWLLLAAVLIAASASVASIILAFEDDHPALGLVIEGSDELNATATTAHLEPGDELVLVVTDPRGREILVGKTIADGEGQATIEGTAKAKLVGPYHAIATVNGAPRAELELVRKP